MADGDLIYLDHQYEFNGLLIGSDTAYLTESWVGMFDAAPNVQSNDVQRNDNNGVVPGPDILGGRTLEATVHILGDRTTVWPLLRDLSTAYQARRLTEILFSFRHPMTNGNVWQIMCRPRKFAAPKDAELTTGHGVAAIQLVSSKPEYYESFVNTSTGLAHGAATVSSQITVSNDGNFPTGPTITLTGPIPAGSYLEVSGQTAFDGITDNGQRFTFSTSVAAGTPVVINFKAKTVTVGGTLRYSYRDTASSWWRMMPKQNVIKFVRPSATGAVTVSCKWQNAWMV